MSATGRKSARLGGLADDYPTPAWCVRRLLEAVRFPSGMWFEPTAGDGAIIRAVNAFFIANDRAVGPTEWRAVEIRPECRARLDEALCAYGDSPLAFIGDFFECRQGSQPIAPSCVITNPPYGIAMEVIQHAMALFPSAVVAMLLRVNFLASEERQPWLRTRPPDVYVLPNRPQFRRNANGARGTDATEYGWFVWPKYPRPYGRVSVLATTPLAERQVEMPL